VCRSCRHWISGGEGGDLDQVVGQDAVPDPDPGAFGAIDAPAIKPVSAFEGADPAFASGSLFHRPPKRRPPLDDLSGFAGLTFSGDHDVSDPEVAQVVLDALLAIARSAVTVLGLRPVRAMTRFTAGASGVRRRGCPVRRCGRRRLRHRGRCLALCSRTPLASRDGLWRSAGHRGGPNCPSDPPVDPCQSGCQCASCQCAKQVVPPERT